MITPQIPASAKYDIFLFLYTAYIIFTLSQSTNFMMESRGNKEGKTADIKFHQNSRFI